MAFDDNRLVASLFGEHNRNLGKLEDVLGVHIADRGNRLTIEGGEDAVDTAESVLNVLWDRLRTGHDIGPAEVEAAVRFSRDEPQEKNGKEPGGATVSDDHKITIRTKKKAISPRTPMQAEYLKAIHDYDMVFGLGPAGTGKTYLAVAAAVALFIEGKVERLIFCRPAVEAGERLGFLPGDMKEKVDPYLRPIYDALHDMLPHDFVQKKMADGDIEIAPLAFMRGRTLSNAFVILDEAQNATPAQMKMFLTRMGENSKAVITGDPSQSDLPKHETSGLAEAVAVLEGVEEIKFVHFSGKDVIRHSLVSRIVQAYDSIKRQ